MTREQKPWPPLFVYALLSLAILGPLLRPGYVLTLDMLFAPHASFSGYFYGLDEWFTSPLAVNTASTPFFLVIQEVSHIIPAWMIEKLVLFLILFLAGLGAHRLFSSKGPGAYFAGLLYMINPFVYVRFMAGQWGVLAAYALTPFAIKALIDLLDTPNARNAVRLAILSTLVGLIQIQGFFLLLLALVIILAVRVIATRNDLTKLKETSKCLAVSALLFCSLNIYWLLPLLTARNSVISQVGSQDLLLFAPKSTSTLGVAFDVAGMYGFWRGGYTYVPDIFSGWWVLFIVILLLATYGFVSHLEDKNRRWLVISLVLLSVISFILALGVAAPATSGIFEWLWQHVLVVRTFRDSQKFVALLCLSYAFLGGLGLNKLAETLKRSMKKFAKIGMIALIVVALASPLAYSFTIFGFYGQLGITDYPQGWYEANKYLNQDKGDFNVLFLPWHEYMDYSWLPNRNKSLGNAAQQFFDKPVIAGDNIEVSGIYSESTNPISKYVEFLLANSSDVNNLGNLLAPLDVKYVILVKEEDYQSYGFLYNQKDLKVLLDEPEITLFENEHTTARAYAVDNVVYINNLKQYLDLSKTQDVMQHLYVIGTATSASGSDEAAQLSLLKKSPVDYQVEGTALKYTIFTVPQNVNTNSWQYNGQKPYAENLGFMPAFASSRTGVTIIYTRFYYVYLPSYVISTLGVVFAAYYFRRRMRP